MPPKKRGGGGGQHKGRGRGRGRGRGYARGGAAGRGGGVTLDFTNNAQGMQSFSPFPGAFPSMGMGMGMGMVPGLGPGMPPGGFPGASPFNNMGAFGKPVTVKMEAHEALVYQNQKARSLYEQQHQYMQWYAAQQQAQNQQQQQHQPASGESYTEEEEWYDEEEDGDAGEIALAKKEAEEKAERLKAIHEQKQTFIRDNLSSFMADFPDDASAGFAALEKAADEHIALPTPEKSKRITEQMLANVAKQTAEKTVARLTGGKKKFSPVTFELSEEDDFPEPEDEEKEVNDLLSLAASADTPAKPVPKSLKASAGILKPSPARTRSRVKVKDLALVNPLPILKQKFQECVMAGKETGASAVNAKFKKQAQSLSDKVSTLVKSRPPVEFETLLEDFDVYKRISIPKTIESRVMQCIWIISRGGIKIDLADFSST